MSTIRNLFSRLFRLILRPLAFVTKEMLQIRRQPQLIIVLILAPFLVLLLFGLGYSGQTPPLETVLVVPADSQLTTDLAEYEDDFVYPLVLVDVTNNREGAVEALEDRRIDVVVALPEGAYHTISSGQRATIDLLYNELIPWQRDWLQFYSRVQTSEINKRVLLETLQWSSDQARVSLDDLNRYPAELQADQQQLESQIESQNYEDAQGTIQTMQDRTAEAMQTTVQLGRFLTGVAFSLGATGVPESQPAGTIAAATFHLTNIQTALANIEVKLNDPETAPEELQADLDYLEQQRNEFATAAGQLPAIPVNVLVSPFEAEEMNLAPTSPSFVDFYSPAVLALLIQHIAVTLTALALVRERIYGRTELFQISPLNAREVLTGKYISYFVQAGILTLILVGTMILALDTPVLGDWETFAGVLALMLAASLGIGFLISAAVRTDAQAIQMAMLLLLASVFFSGFFLPLDNLSQWVAPVSYALPVTYGIEGLQLIMLRGELPPTWTLTSLAAIAVITTLGAWLLLHLQFRRR